MSDWRDRFRGPDVRILLLVFGVALVLRLIVVGAVTPDPRDGRFDDSVWYDTAARHLADGKGYVFDPTVWRVADGSPVYAGETALSPTALWPPGYPLMLAGIYKLTDDSVTAARLANALFGALTAALVFVIARRMFDRTSALFAGLALALLPSHLLFTSILLSETFFGFILALSLAIFVWCVAGVQRPHPLVLLALGALVAFGGLVRGEFLAYGGVLALIVALTLRRDAVVPLAALAAGAALVLTPWAIRNEVTMGEAIVGTTGAGRVMYQGHNPDSDGGPSLIATGQLEARFAGLPRKEIELQSNREGSKLAREWALDHPLDELRLVGRRMYLLFRTDEAGVTWLQSNKPWFSPENADKLIFTSTFAFYALIALAVASAPVWWRSWDPARWAVFAVVPFYMLVFGVLFIGDPRYHYAMYVPITVFAGVGAAAACRLTAAHWRDAFGERSFGQMIRRYGTPEP